MLLFLCIILFLIQNFTGNTDSTSLEVNYFPQRILARIVRITCETQHIDHWGLRFEILGYKLQPCSGNATQYLGMANDDIPDSNIQTSHGSSKGRLYGPPFHSRVTGNPWVEADIGYRTCVSGVVTQGDGHSGVSMQTGSLHFWYLHLHVPTLHKFS